MKNHPTIFLISILIITGCKSTRSDSDNIISTINSEISSGNLNVALRLADSLKNISKDEKTTWRADSLSQIVSRIPLDFSLTEAQLTEQIEKRTGDSINQDDLKIWADRGWLEFRIINGEKRYFSRAASNLLLLKSFNNDRAGRDSAEAKTYEKTYRKIHTSIILGQSKGKPDPVVPVSMEIVYTLTVEPDAVPAGEIIRCWLPYPKENSKRQTDVYLLGISDDEFFVLSPDTMTHRTIYMEKKAEKGAPTIFQAAFSYKSYGQYFDPSSIKTLPYDKNSEFYKKYTSEQLPHICFTPGVKTLADSITGFETNPFEIVKKIYLWFNKKIPWAGALEYSIIPNIPEYVITNKKGDCGMQTFLFMSMLRYKGIPVKWQSGWMVPPGNKNLHDWCEVYYEGTGWVPVDISYSLQYSPDQKLREFYISGIDSYRLLVNDGISGDLYPKKKYLRSEPFDFQRGEVEWSGGNLYFDKWDYNMKIEYK
jgi:transglutaminase-like putative cysteine protease